MNESNIVWFKWDNPIHGVNWCRIDKLDFNSQTQTRYCFNDRVLSNPIIVDFDDQETWIKNRYGSNSWKRLTEEEAFLELI